MIDVNQLVLECFLAEGVTEQQLCGAMCRVQEVLQLNNPEHEEKIALSVTLMQKGVSILEEMIEPD